MGTGNSPPARKLAVCPFIAIKLGSARERKAPLVLSALMKAAVLSPELKRKRFTALPANSVIRLLFSRSLPRVPGPPPCAKTEVLLPDAYDEPHAFNFCRLTSATRTDN